MSFFTIRGFCLCVRMPQELVTEKRWNTAHFDIQPKAPGKHPEALSTDRFCLFQVRAVLFGYHVTSSGPKGLSIIDRHVFVVVAVNAGKCSLMKMSNGNLALVLILLVSCSGADLATEFAETSEGGSASLPCNLEPVQPPDRVVNVLWYR